MKHDDSQLPWIHIGECPICVDGLCRVRCCDGDHVEAHLFAICDECEALWQAPNTACDPQFPNARQPLCPICHRDLYGEQSHWARAEELHGTEWSAAAIFEMPTQVLDDAIEVLDAPPQNQIVDESVLKRGYGSEMERDLSYGQDDPRPGC